MNSDMVILMVPAQRGPPSGTAEDRRISIPRYLSAGILFIAPPGMITDVLNSGPTIPGPHVFTDGVWAWPSDLVYCLQAYHIVLPDDLVRHIARRKLQPPAEDSVDLANLTL